MRIAAAIITVVLVLILLAVVTTIEGAFTIVLGWIPFLGRVLPEAEPDGPSVLVGALALILFGGCVHWLGRSRVSAVRRWRMRWTVAVVLGVVLLFAAGVSIVGISHQVAWLATSDQPMVGEGLKRRRDAREIGIGISSYSGVMGKVPPGGTFSADGEMLHSWETQILPYMGYSTQGIDMTEPWNGPENRRYFQCELPEFINPEFRTPPLADDGGYGLSHYAINSRVARANGAVKVSDLKRGAANTILVGEVNAGFKPWGHPVNWRDPAAGLNRGPATFGGAPRSGSTTFLMADGSVRVFANRTDPAVLRALSDPNAVE